MFGFLFKFLKVWTMRRHDFFNLVHPGKITVPTLGSIGELVHACNCAWEIVVRELGYSVLAYSVLASPTQWVWHQAVLHESLSQTNIQQQQQNKAHPHHTHTNLGRLLPMQQCLWSLRQQPGTLQCLRPIMMMDFQWPETCAGMVLSSLSSLTKIPGW